MDNILPVVVLYNKKILESIALESLNKAAAYSEKDERLKVLIYDNSSSPQEVPQVSNLEFIYYNNTENVGVSTAYNKGAELAQSLNKEWILLLDHDTRLPVEFLKIAYTHITKYKYNLFAPILKSNDLIISPCTYYLKKGFPKKVINTGPKKIRYINFLNSGLIIKISAFNKVNGFDKNIKLYFSDFEFIDRFKKHYPWSYILPIELNHNLRDIDESSFESATITFPHYCDGARLSSKGRLDFIQYLIIVSLRALILTKRYKSMLFVRILIAKFIMGKTSKI